MPPLDHVAVQAIALSDDNGSRRARVTAVQFARWVDFANRAFDAAGIRFTFDPEDGFEEMRNTALNDMSGSGEANWPAVKALGNRIAARYPDRLVVFVRHGPGSEPDRSGFAGIDHDFVVMGGFEDMNHCGHPHVDALAHEIGHYLGLPHTFVGEPFADVQAAADYFAAKGRDPLAFDGDGFTDTPPDPAIRALECEPRQEVVLLGHTFTLPRRNLMSYYDERDSLSGQQIERVRWVLARRQRNGMHLPLNRPGAEAFEAETLKVISADGCHASVQAMDGFGAGLWSGGAQLFSNARIGARLTLELPVSGPGQFRLVLYATLAPDFARLRCSVDDRACESVIDLFAPMVLPTGAIRLGVFELATDMHRISFEVEGKHSGSQGYHFGIDAIELAD